MDGRGEHAFGPGRQCVGVGGGAVVAPIGEGSGEREERGEEQKDEEGAAAAAVIPVGQSTQHFLLLDAALLDRVEREEAIKFGLL